MASVSFSTALHSQAPDIGVPIGFPAIGPASLGALSLGKASITPISIHYDWQSRAEKPGVDWFRPVDIAMALLALVALAPLLLVVTVAVGLSSSGPVFYAHRRIGRGGRGFACLKFRTMVVDAEARLHHLLASDPMARAQWQKDHKLRRDPRVTPIGAFLRKSSLDELPQLFNVLGGSMSLVGPRPIVAGEVARYGNRFADYCKVRPGITGLWQVNGRSDTSYRARVAMDVLYVRRRSLRLNGMIIFKTLPAVMLQRGSC